MDLMGLQGDCRSDRCPKHHAYQPLPKLFTTGLKQNGLITDGTLSSYIHSFSLFGMKVA